jgi:hypothetical protein
MSARKAIVPVAERALIQRVNVARVGARKLNTEGARKSNGEARKPNMPRLCRIDGGVSG